MVGKTLFLAYLLLTTFIVMINCEVNIDKNITKSVAETVSTVSDITTTGSVEKENITEKATTEYEGDAEIEEKLDDRAADKDEDPDKPRSASGEPPEATTNLDDGATTEKLDLKSPPIGGGVIPAVYIKTEMARFIVLLYLVKTVGESLLTTIY